MAVYRPTIGLEVHAELLTNAKMFCGCPVVDLTTAEANIAICEVCTGTPGTLPVLNGRAVELALSVALALNCSIAETSQFARKNYFYPDLPKGYQISQYELPLASQGHIVLPREAGEKLVRIRRVHLEEDTGKLLHTPHSTLIDYNRSGVPLLEIVTEPDLESVEEAGLYASWLRILLRTLGANSGDMEKGVIRFEANVSVQPEGSEALGTRTEIKNLNSFRAMLRSISYELERQTALLDSGQSVRQETLGWDEQSGTTHSQRSKEEAHDYRYFPEPDLPPLVVSRDWIHRLRDALPELPAARLRRFQREYALRLDQAQLLIEQPAIADYFEAVVRLADSSPPTGIAQWITGELFALLHASGRTFDDPSLLLRLHWQNSSAWLRQGGSTCRPPRPYSPRCSSWVAARPIWCASAGWSRFKITVPSSASWPTPCATIPIKFDSTWRASTRSSSGSSARSCGLRAVDPTHPLFGRSWPPSWLRLKRIRQAREGRHLTGVCARPTVHEGAISRPARSPLEWPDRSAIIRFRQVQSENEGRQRERI